MKSRHFTTCLAACLLAALYLSWLCLGVGHAAPKNAGGPSANDPRLDLVTALKAMGPHPSLGDQANVFGRFVGTWDVEYMDISKDGKEIHRSGALIVGWVMDGRAIQDLWIVNPSGKRKDREVYTDLRYYDPKSRTWPAAFIDPENVSVARFTGGAEGDDRIVLDTQDLGAGTHRWSFNDIRDGSFVFRDEGSRDGGKTWKLVSEYHMTRRRVSPPAH